MSQYPTPMPPPPPALQPARGRFFQFGVPPGWRVGEEGQYAIVLFAPDHSALTMVTGNCGLAPGYPPMQFVQEKLAIFRYPDLRMSPPRPARPAWPGGGFMSAWECDYVYSFNGQPCRGITACHARPGYDSCDLIVTCAASLEFQWPYYSGWLPRVPEQTMAIDAGAFGAAGIAQQNLANSAAFGQQARQQREWSAATWNQVTQERQASQDQQNDQFRQTIGNVTRYDNPYDHRPVELSSSNAVYWVNPHTGQILGSPNPAFDPRSPADASWQPMRKKE